ncbi:MAG: hypothetical protein JNL58_22095 [Planctomyces sp.]|nr:hypothetical protein [Planctomyces sp.]
MQKRKKCVRCFALLILLGLMVFEAPESWSQQLEDSNQSSQKSGRRKNRAAVKAEPAASPVRIKRAPLKSDLEEFPLPGVVSRTCVGGGGRMIFLLIPDLKKLAVFDVEKSKITHYLPAPQEDAYIAAGIDKLFIASQTSGTLERYDLATFRKEVTAKLPVEGRIGALLMGSASIGPLFICGVDGMLAVDSISLTEHSFNWLRHNGESSDRSPFSFQNDTPQLQISANGRVIVNCSRGGLSIFRRHGKHSFMGAEATTQSGRIQNGIPSPDGRIIYGDGQVFSVTGVPTSQRSRESSGGWLVPSVENAFYVSLQQLGNRNNTLELGLAIGVQGEHQSVINIEEPVGLDGLVSYPSGQTARFDQHIFFVPDANVLAVLPLSKDRLFLHRIDIEKQLDEAGIDYLIVVSQAPSEVVPGRELKYQIEARAKKGEVEYVLESGPDGMTLSADGLVEWPVPASLADDEVNVIITLRDSTGQQIFHNLKLEKCDPENDTAPKSLENPALPE